MLLHSIIRQQRKADSDSGQDTVGTRSMKYNPHLQRTQSFAADKTRTSGSMRPPAVRAVCSLSRSWCGRCSWEGPGAELWRMGVRGKHSEREGEPEKQHRGGQRRQAHACGWSQGCEVTRHSLLVLVRTLEIGWSRPTFKAHSDPHR